MRILIGYASQHGSTREIAERIAQRLRDGGHNADAQELTGAGDAAGYEAFVIGSAIHGGDWLPPAIEYVNRNADLLAARPLWLFSVGMASVVGGWFEKHVRDPKAVATFRTTIRSREHHLFAGAIRHDHFPPIGRVFYRLMRGRYGDFRDWADVDAWAESIATDLSMVPRTHPKGAGHEGTPS
ncbi:flavodoxin domain-containing protein [Salinactinospora qingdaonensis]|uniref:Flavodoxin domain-containing protein n=1 Tax=Salinactinospora qingdaonensis TaxID=702744 RepID=A0ABP7GAQ4_9ACTN